MSDIPLIDVEKHFNDPAIPDGSNVGFVSPHGVVHDAKGRPIGIDHKHENAKDPNRLAELRQLVARNDRGSAAKLGKPHTMCPLGMCVADIGHGGRCTDEVAPNTAYESERNRPGEGAPLRVERKIERQWRLDGKVIVLDNLGDLWALSGIGGGWVKAQLDNIPPLPREV